MVKTFPIRNIRWHGRGGFGAKTAALLLAEAVIEAGGYAQASPEFGPERRGAPVQAYTRVSPYPIRRRGPIEEPDVVVVLDHRLLAVPDVLRGIRPSTWVVVNAPRPVRAPGVPVDQVVTVDASGIAQRVLGRDLPNIAVLAVVAVELVGLPAEAFCRWLRERLRREFPEEVTQANVQVAREAMEEGRKWRIAGRSLTAAL
ncbi:MAG: 2-oxoacid:acceptor oxidoreductase family protein [Armatimonadetes bacterium]|nr:2-oxoacid:acceptor oxidoreductase family protein [Armatimonadota bacterium]MDW8154315.1 2-oxoacid:acceptor oxidoreductase family protein [Armatimonadota bacterium]